jgi:DNA-binding beta-propeller fold protein YncE
MAAVIVGNAFREYEVAEGWAKVPSTIQLGYTHGIESDSAGNMYIFHTNKPTVVKFDGDGNYLSSWGDEYEGGAHGFLLSKENGQEYFYLTDTSGRVVKTTLDGEVLLTIGTPDLPNVYDAERKFVPTDVAVAPNGDIYVADGYGQNYIHQYNEAGEPIRSWGGAGSAPGQMNCPHGISVDLRGDEPELYVADRGNHRIQVFTMDGQHKRFIDENMDLPCNFYYYGDEVVFPDLNSRVTILDRNDKLIAHLGEDQQAYKQQGWPDLPLDYFRANRFSSPHGVCVDAQGNIFVVEWTRFGRITKLVRSK